MLSLCEPVPVGLVRLRAGPPVLLSAHISSCLTRRIFCRAVQPPALMVSSAKNLPISFWKKVKTMTSDFGFDFAPVRTGAVSKSAVPADPLRA